MLRFLCPIRGVILFDKIVLNCDFYHEIVVNYFIFLVVHEFLVNLRLILDLFLPLIMAKVVELFLKRAVDQLVEHFRL